jgi:hypothetical protein
MNKTNTISVSVGCHNVGDRWDLEIIPKFKKIKDTKAIKRLDIVERMVAPSGHDGHAIFPNEEKEKMINKNNDKNKVRTDKRFSVVIFTCFALFIGAVVLASGSTATMSVYAVTTQTLPTCVDPTGHNLPCIMVISKLPPPPNPLQCQETSGQILACSYATQNLSNGELILVITV